MGKNWLHLKAKGVPNLASTNGSFSYLFQRVAHHLLRTNIDQTLSVQESRWAF